MERQRLRERMNDPQLLDQRIAEALSANAITSAMLAALFGEVETAIAAAGNRIFASIDQSAAARDAGTVLRPTTLLVFGNPKGGTVLMDAQPPLGLDLPLKFLVWEADGVRVAYTRAAALAARYGLEGHETLLGAIDRMFESLVAAVS